MLLVTVFFVSGELSNPGYTAHPAFRVSRTLGSQHEAKAGQRNLERVERIELSHNPWQGPRLPLHHTRIV